MLVYVIGGVILYFFQDTIFVRAQKLGFSYKFNFQAPYKEVNLAVNEKKNLSIVQFTVPDSVCKGVVLYFHGNKKKHRTLRTVGRLFHP